VDAVAEKKLEIVIGRVSTVGPSRRSAEELPYWGVIFNINRADGVGTAIGFTIRCEYPQEAKREAIEKLKSFLHEAWQAAVTAPIRDPEAEMTFDLTERSD
jgi:hypothetical protein